MAEYTNYVDLKKAVEQEVRNDAAFSLASLANESEWWLSVIRGRHDGNVEVEKLRRTELIWSYWMEEGGLVQSLNAICLRFQNKSSQGNPLSHLDVSPLYPVSDLLWGFIEDEKNRLSLNRRAHEYEKEYGISMVGAAIGRVSPADSRSRFLQSFHSLLNTTLEFYTQLDDLNVAEDGRPVLNSLKELQRILSEGAYNQYKLLPVQARIEMRIMQEILGRRELSEFLSSRAMHNYPETWMAHLDTMWKIMKWGDPQVTEFVNLADAGERLLLSVRLGPFGPTQKDGDVARSWASEFRDHLTQYVCSYRAVTGVDLSVKPSNGRVVDANQPSMYLAERERAAHRVAFR